MVVFLLRNIVLRWGGGGGFVNVVVQNGRGFPGVTRGWLLLSALHISNIVRSVLITMLGRDLLKILQRVAGA